MTPIRPSYDATPNSATVSNVVAVNDPVQKFTFLKGECESTFVKTVAKIDAPAKDFFTRLWVQTTYKMKRSHAKRHGHDFPRVVWPNLDGTRALQCSSAHRFLQGMSNRYFETWLTWVARSLGDGRMVYIIAHAPIEFYRAMGGKSYNYFDGAGKFLKASARGVHVVREITQNTCEVRSGEERSNELRRRVPGILASNADTSVGNVGAANSTTVSNVTNTSFLLASLVAVDKG